MHEGLAGAGVLEEQIRPRRGPIVCTGKVRRSLCDPLLGTTAVFLYYYLALGPEAPQGSVRRRRLLGDQAPLCRMDGKVSWLWCLCVVVVVFVVVDC